MSDHLDPLKVARIVDRFRYQLLRGEPDWKPLESALPAAWCGGFMWMIRITQGETVVELYKHGITRRYLNLDHQGGAWRYDHEGSVYRPEPLDSAIEAVFQGIELCGADRSTVYDTGYLSARDRRLRDQGWEGDHVSPPAECWADGLPMIGGDIHHRRCLEACRDRTVGSISDVASRSVIGRPLMDSVLWIREPSCG